MILKNLLGRIFRRYENPGQFRRDILQMIPTFISVGDRAVVRKTRMNNTQYLKKTFEDNEAGRASFHNEIFADQLFNDKPWKVPIINKGPLWFTLPFLPDEKRLDRIAPKLNEQMRIEIARQAISLLFDIFFAGYVHRDINIKNFFWIDEQLKLIDFEFLEAYPEAKRPSFLALPFECAAFISSKEA